MQAALVTGSSRGIGLAAAKALVREGFVVALNGPEDDAELKTKAMLMLLARRKVMSSKPFKPDYAPSPGLLLEVHLESYDMSASEFARRCGRPVEFIEELLSGSAPLDREIARLIDKEFGGEAEAWLRMEEEYRQKLASDAEKRAGRDTIWGRFLFLPRVLSRAYRSLGRDRRSLPRQS